MLVLLGPIGMLISAFMLIKRHWDSIVEAFKSDGIIGALKRIGIVLLDVLMHPLQRILGWVAELTDWQWAKMRQALWKRSENGWIWLLTERKRKMKKVAQKLPKNRCSLRKKTL